jgi:hypothetical protein
MLEMISYNGLSYDSSSLPEGITRLEKEEKYILNKRKSTSLTLAASDNPAMVIIEPNMRYGTYPGTHLKFDRLPMISVQW